MLFFSSIRYNYSSGAQDSTSPKCPSCIEGNIESIPIAENENYRFDYNTKRGIVMEFFR
jgi:hypothetical protein